MSEENPNPNSQDGGNGGGQQPNNGGNAPATPPVAALFEKGRPDWMPEKYWVDGKPEEAVQKLAGAYTALRGQFGKGKDAYKAEYEAERLKGRPAKPEDYKFAAPKEGLPADIVLLDKQPGADFKPDADKRYVVLDEKNPMLSFWRQTAHASGMDQATFDKGVAMFINNLAGDVPTQADLKAAREAEYAKLGEQGQARAQHVFRQATAVLGEEKARALDGVVESAEGIEAIELLLEKAGGARFAPGDVAAASGGQSLEDLKAMQRDPKYKSDPAFFRKVTDGFTRLERLGLLKAKH